MGINSEEDAYRHGTKISKKRPSSAVIKIG
jgi:hypothetical protein